LERKETPLKIVFISDTHLRHRNYPIDVPECDLLIHSGDALSKGSADELRQFAPWFDGLKAKRKIFVAGNHDWVFEKENALARSLLPKEVIYLQDELVEVGGLKIYGSPWQPEFCEWAFNLVRGWPLRKKWEAIPEGIDILVTHGPPMGILDYSKFGNEHVGCGDLRQELYRVKPKIHAFGHIHGDYGTAVWANTLFVNASLCDEAYVASHPPIAVEYEPGKVPVILPGPGLPPPVKGAIPIRRTTPPLWS
jgi:Icc-related predicted phosphoesterase